MSIPTRFIFLAYAPDNILGRLMTVSGRRSPFGAQLLLETAELISESGKQMQSSHESEFRATYTSSLSLPSFRQFPSLSKPMRRQPSASASRDYDLCSSNQQLSVLLRRIFD